jgi:general secretion pathway protein N
MQALKQWMMGGALCGILYAAIAYAPASWLANGVASGTGGQLLLQAPRGTVWQGSADLVMSGGAGSAGAVSLPSRLKWQISPAWFGFDVSLSASCCTLAENPVRLSLSTAALDPRLGVDWRLNTAHLRVPAELLTGLGAPWNTLQLAGEFLFASENLSGVWSGQGLQSLTGRASLQARQVATALSTVRPLGSYLLTSADSVLRLETLADAPTDAVLILTGRGQIEAGRASFQGEAVAASGREEALSNLLHIVGQWQPSTDGRSRSILKL